MSPTFFLNFHGLGEPHAGVDDGERPYWLSRDMFAEVLKLAGKHFASIGITFDDGNLSDLHEAAPMLRAAGMQADFFICTDRIGTPHYLGADDIRALAAEGMDIGSHGLVHTDWTALDDEELEAEVAQPLKVLSDIVRAPVRSVGVPFGQYDERVLRALKRYEIEAVYTSDGGPCRPGAWLIPRTSLRNDMSMSEIDAMLSRPRGAAAYYVRAAKRAGRRVLRQLAG